MSCAVTPCKQASAAVASTSTATPGHCHAFYQRPLVVVYRSLRPPLFSARPLDVSSRPCSGQCCRARLAQREVGGLVFNVRPNSDVSESLLYAEQFQEALEGAPIGSWQKQEAAEACPPPLPCSPSSTALGSQRTASVSRAIIAAQPGRVAQQALRGGRGRGLSVPSALLVFAVTAGAAVWTAVRQRVQAVRDCQSCKGYGIQRCKLCNGKGAISWEGKMAHNEPCPMCLGRRYTRCGSCGGAFTGRPTFAHLHGADAAEASLDSTLSGFKKRAAGDRGAVGRDGEGSGRGSSKRDGGLEGQSLIAQINALSQEIMTD